MFRPTLLWFVLAPAVLILSCSKKVNPEKPFLSSTAIPLDTIPLSEINIPVQVALKPVFTMAEKTVDTLFTSPHYPDEWVQDGCDTRYKYSFRRGPLQLKAMGNRFMLGFTGYYRIIGSTRICVKGTAISPWTPPCKCGFDEDERRVNVSFTNSVSLYPDYTMKLQVVRNEPQPLDKCEVCFWGQDITTQVLNGLKAELDASKADLEKQYGTVNLRARFQQVWDQLSKPFDLYGMGWLSINPAQFRITSLYAKNDSLYINMGLMARPSVSLDKPVIVNNRLPDMQTSPAKPGFAVHLGASLNYDSLGNILNRQLAGKEFDLDKGVVKKKIVVKDCRLAGADADKMIVRVSVTGSNEGIFYLSGKPYYDPATHILELHDIDFDIRSRNALFKAADLLFRKKMISEIGHYARYDLGAYMESAKSIINSQLNREWLPGVRGTGGVDNILITGIYPQQKELIVRSSCTGALAVHVESIPFSL